MPSFRSGSTSARRDLATRLRWARLDAELTSVQLAEAINVSRGKISKVERGNQSVRVDVVAGWLRACGVPEREYDELLDLAEYALTGVSPWRHEHRAGMTAKQTQVGHLESSARRIRVFQASIVPGLLQTVGYARTILRLADLSGQRDVDAAADARIQRQRILDDSTKTLEFIVTLPALSWRIDPDQRERLIKALRDGIRLGVVPTEADTPPAINSFVIYEFTDDDPTVVVETFTGEVYYDDARDVAVYMECFEDFAAAACYDAEAERLITPG